MTSSRAEGNSVHELQFGMEFRFVSGWPRSAKFPTRPGSRQSSMVGAKRRAALCKYLEVVIAIAAEETTVARVGFAGSSVRRVREKGCGAVLQKQRNGSSALRMLK